MVRRILNELEELQQAILASRATRERAEAAFDTQLRAFDEPRPGHRACAGRGSSSAPACRVDPVTTSGGRPAIADHAAEAESLP